MRKKHWRAAAAVLIAGSMTVAMAGCSGRAADIAQSVIGMDALQSRITGKDSSDSSSKTESADSKEVSTASGKDSSVSKAESADSGTKSVDSKAESTDSKAESTDSKTGSTASKTESTESGTDSKDDSKGSKDDSKGSTESTESAESKGEKPKEKVVITGEGLDLAALLILDNTHLTAGYGAPYRDELNRPQETVNLQEQFGDEKCEFLHGTDQTIHLVFTAGYANSSTNAILDVLKEKGVKATFFLTGYSMEDNPEIVKRILEEGHTLGSHSYSHPTYGMDTYTVEQIIDDSMRAQKYIRDTYDYEMQYYSFPSGYFSERALETIKAMGYHVVFYSFAYNDYDEENMISPDEAIAQLYAQLHVGEICQLHATSPSSAAVLASFIEGARELGYTFENFE